MNREHRNTRDQEQGCLGRLLEKLEVGESTRGFRPNRKPKTLEPIANRCRSLANSQEPSDVHRVVPDRHH